MPNRVENCANNNQTKPGIINHGYDYEYFLPAFLALKFFQNTTIKNFTLSLNPPFCEKFDDLRIDIEDKDDRKICYLFQLKYKEAEKERQNASILERGDKFNLQRYLHSYNDITEDGVEITGIILYTNIQLEQLDKLKRYEISIIRCDDQLNFFNTSTNIDGIFKFQDKASNEHKSFFDNFYLLSNQMNVPNLKESIIEIFEKQYGAGPETAIMYLDLFKELRQKEQDTDRIVTKDEIVKQLLGLLLKDSIIVGTTTEHNESIDLIENIFEQFDITLLQECDNNLIPYHSQTEHIFENKPLFVRVNAQFKKKITSTIRLCKSAEFNVKFVLVGEGITREDLPEIVSFQNLSDLETRCSNVYKELASKAKLSLQGRKVTSLETLATTYGLGHLKYFLTPDEIFSLIRGDLIIGDKLQPLPEPYISRSLINEQHMEIKDGDITFDNQLNQICAKPGSGKTTLMKYLINSSPLDHWIVNFTAKESSDLFQKVCKVNEILKYLFYKGQENNKLLGRFREMKKIIFFFDGLDELNIEHQKNAFESIKNLVRAEFQIWMFFRCDLENIPKFDNGDSGTSLRQYQIKDFEQNDIEEYIKQRLKDSNNTVEGLNAIEGIIKKENFNLLKVPLYLYIITEIMKENNNSLQEIKNEASLYNYFIKGKFKHYANKTGGRFEDIWDEFKEYILEQYQIAAIKTVLERHLFKLLPISINKKFIHDIKKKGDNLGIVRKVDSCGNLIFDHHTYGEYLTASWLTENFDRVPVVWRKFILQKYKRVKQFCDLIFDVHFPLDCVTLYCYAAVANRFDLIEKAINQEKYEHEQLFKTYLQMAATDGFLKLLKFLISKCGADIDTLNEKKQTLLHVAARNGRHEVVKFLIEQKNELLEARDLMGMTPLHLAAQIGHRKTIIVLHENGANINALDTFGRTPLHYASYVGKIAAVEYLINNNAKIDELDVEDRTLLHRAAQKGHRKIVACLLEKNANPYLEDKYKSTPLHLAAENNHLEIVTILVNKMDNIEGTDEDGKTAFNIATERRHKDMVKFFKDVKKNSPRKIGEPRVDHYKSALHQAAKKGDLERIQKILDSGGSINSIDKHHPDKNTILHIAALEGYSKIVDFLLEKNAKTSIKNRDDRVPLHLAAQRGHINIVQSLINKNKNDLEVADRWGMLPLHRASYKGHITIIELFLQNGVNVNTLGLKGGTALHSAARGGRIEAIDYLIQEGGDLEAKDRTKKTCLHLATQEGHVEVVKHLIQQKSSLLNETDAFGRTALHRAVENRNFNSVKYLVEAGANIDIQNDNKHTPLDIAEITKQDRILEYLRQIHVKMVSVG